MRLTGQAFSSAGISKTRSVNRSHEADQPGHNAFANRVVLDQIFDDEDVSVHLLRRAARQLSYPSAKWTSREADLRLDLAQRPVPLCRPLCTKEQRVRKPASRGKKSSGLGNRSRDDGKLFLPFAQRWEASETARGC